MSRVPQKARTASHSSDCSGKNVRALAPEVCVIIRPPAIPAKKAEMQKTMTRVMFTDSPNVESIAGVSAIPRSSLPIRPRFTSTSATQLASAIPSTM